jgi:serine/threonine-protein kinase
VATRRYELGEKIGEGGFGCVYRGRLVGEGGFGKEVAIKLLHPEKQVPPEIASRLRDEARLLGHLNARSIVRVEDLVQLDDRWAVIMEFVPGEDLGAAIKRGPLPPRVAAEVAGEVARALEAAWGGQGDSGPLRVVHRDIKPANIRITPSGDVRVLDFGVAQSSFAEREAETRSLSFGSPGYLAPERYEGVDTHAADIFALGVVLCECLTGKKLGQLPPHPDRLATAREASIAPIRPPSLRDLVRRMLAYGAADRPTATEVARRLRDLAPTLEGPWLADWARDVVGTTGPQIHPLASAGTASTLVPAGGASAATARSAALVLALAAPLGGFAAVVLLGSLGLGLWTWWGSRRAGEHVPAPVAAVPAPPGPAPTTSPSVNGSSPAPLRPAPPRPPAAAEELPTPEEGPAARPEAVMAFGRVDVLGDAEVSLRGDDGSVLDFDAVPAGTVHLTAVFADGGSAPPLTLTVAAGQTTRVKCLSTAGTCRRTGGP